MMQCMQIALRCPRIAKIAQILLAFGGRLMYDLSVLRLGLAVAMGAYAARIIMSRLRCGCP